MLFFFILLALGCSNLLDFSVDLGSPYPELDKVTFGGLNAYITPGNTPDGFHAADPFNTPSAFRTFTTALDMGTRRNMSGFPSSTFLATRLYGNIHAERFVVPSNDVWTLESVVIPVTCATSDSTCAQPGFTSSPEYYQLRVSLFNNNVNGAIVSPGGVVKEVDGVFEIVNSSTNVYGHPTHNLRVNFSETIELSAGTYWLGITQVGYAADVISEAKSSNNIMRLAESSLIWGSKWNDFDIGADSRTHNMQEHVDWANLFINSCPNPSQTFRLNYSTQNGSCVTLTAAQKLQALQEIMCLAGEPMGDRFSFCYYTDRMRGPRPPGPPFANQTLSGWFPNFGMNPFSLTELKLNVKCVSNSSNFVSISGRIYQGDPTNAGFTSVRPNSTNWDAIGLKADSIICGGLDFEANSTLENFHLPPRRNTPHPGSFRDVALGTGRDCYTTVSDSTKWLSSQTYFMMKNVANMSTGATTDSLGSEIEGAMRDIFFENDLKVMYLYGSCTGSCVGPVTSTSQPSSSSTSTSSTSSASTSSPDSSSSATALVFGLFL